MDFSELVSRWSGCIRKFAGVYRGFLLSADREDLYNEGCFALWEVANQFVTKDVRLDSEEFSKIAKTAIARRVMWKAKRELNRRKVVISAVEMKELEHLVYRDIVNEEWDPFESAAYSETMARIYKKLEQRDVPLFQKLVEGQGNISKCTRELGWTRKRVRLALTRIQSITAEEMQYSYA